MPRPYVARLTLASVLTSLLLVPAIARAEQPAPSPSQARFEVRFMTEMIDHHMMAVMMGEMCLQKAVQDELRATCQNIVTSQMQEIETMQAWLLDWYGISYEPEMTPGMEHQMDQMAERAGPSSRSNS